MNCLRLYCGSPVPLVLAGLALVSCGSDDTVAGGDGTPNVALVGAIEYNQMLSMANHVRVAEGRAYVADAFGARGLALGAAHAYVASFTGIDVFDIADPPRPASGASRQVDWENTGSPYRFELHIADDRLYVAGSAAGLIIFDVSDPANPREIGAYRAFEGETRGEVEFRGVQVDGGLAYLAGGPVEIVDVSRSESPAHVGFYAGGGGPEDLCVVFIGATHDMEPCDNYMTVLDIAFTEGVYSLLGGESA